MKIGTNTTATNVFSTAYTANRLNQYTGIMSSWDNGASTSASTQLYDRSEHQITLEEIERIRL